MDPFLPHFFRGLVVLQMAIWTAVAVGASAALSWTGNPVYFRTFRGRLLFWFLPSVPILLWRWVSIAEFYRGMN